MTENSFPTQSPLSLDKAPTGAEKFYARIRRSGIVRDGDRWVGGVAAALARKIGVAPVVVRIGFVVLALFGGIGVALYGLGWALLPDRTGRIEAEAAQHGDVSGAGRRRGPGRPRPAARCSAARLDLVNRPRWSVRPR